MIKKSVLFFAALSVGAFGLQAQDTPSVGVVDLDLVLQEYDRFQEAQEELGKQQERADAELRPMVDSINSLREEIQAANDRINNPTSSEESQMEARNELRQLQAELEQQAIQFQRLRAEAQRTIGQREQNMMSMIVEDVRGAAATVAEDMGLDLVLSSQNQIVLFFDGSLEISDAVLEQLKEGGEGSE
jgi:Skp family chaperone for outer membrane proteins